MRKFIITLILVLGSSFISYGQENLNDYKYIIVPKKYEFLKEADKYQLNSLTKFLFNKKGFTAIMESEDYPDDLKKNRCLGLTSSVVNNSSMFKTKLLIELRNCDNNVVYKSDEGSSKEKEYKKAYNFALRNAFKSFDDLNYKYQPKSNTVTKVNNQEAIVKKEIASEVIAEPEAENVKVSEVLESNINNDGTLYAQAISKGFQVVDSTPKVIMILLSTAKQNVFVAEGMNAIVYKEDGFWYLSKGTNKKQLNIKF